MRRWSVVLAMSAALGACSGSTQGCPPCASADTCLEGGVCALACSPDAGTPCRAGQLCQETCAYCVGTECTCALTWVCLPVELAAVTPAQTQ